MSEVLCVESAVQGLTALGDRELVDEVTRRAARERHATGELLRALIEFDRRQLYLGEGFSSLFAYCTQALHYSEHAAFNRIEVARAAARWPQLLTCIEDGSLHLAGARLLAPHLTEENIEQTLAEARHRSKREIEEVAARLAQRAILVAVDAEQYRLYLTISRQARDTLRQVQALIRHQVTDGNVAVIFEQALSLLLEKLQRQRFAATAQPQAPDQTAQPEEPTEVAEPRPPVMGDSRSRRIPAAVHRAVWQRDGGQCAFVGHQGRCAERTLLEFHHIVPYAAGGAGTAQNIELRCRAHNRYEAELYFGEGAVRPRQVKVKVAQRPGFDPSAAKGGSGTRPGASPVPDAKPSPGDPKSPSRTRSS
jgi:5-methylcytosine-specific restriction endonuclease McrA